MPFPTFFKDCTVPKGCFFRLSLGLKMVEVCGSNPTLPIPQCSFNFFKKKKSSVEIQSLMVSDAFNSLTHRVLTSPKGTAEIHFSSPAHRPHYPPTCTGGRAHPGESRKSSSRSPIVSPRGNGKHTDEYYIYIYIIFHLISLFHLFQHQYHSIPKFHGK